MKVLLIWSGKQSYGVALLLQKYFSCMCQGLTILLSDDEPSMDSIERFTRGNDGDSIYGLICLTPDNLACPWLVFQAGVLSGSRVRLACLLLGGLTTIDIVDPLARFECLRFAEDEVRFLLTNLINRLQAPAPPEQSALIFEKSWPEFERECGEIARPRPREGNVLRTDREILEECLLRLRKIEGASAASGVRPQEPLHATVGPGGHQSWLRLERSWVLLTRNQKALLSDLVSSRSSQHPSDETAMIRKYPPSDFLALLQKGLVGMLEDGEAEIDEFTAEFVESKGMARKLMGR